jgi:regulator of protease activity HflC (stomatin/prohibitin superfamily)
MADFREALTALAHTGVRKAVGELPVHEALAARVDIGMALRTSLDDTTQAWGVAVHRVEVHRVEAPADLVTAMVELVTAERAADALVTEAEAEREAAIARAEGERKALELKADGERAARRTAAEADADAIRVFYEAIRDFGPSADEVAARSVEVLRELATAGAALTVVLPSGGPTRPPHGHTSSSPAPPAAPGPDAAWPAPATRRPA